MKKEQDFDLFEQDGQDDLFLAIKNEVRPEHFYLKKYLNHLFKEHHKVLDQDFRKKLTNGGQCGSRIFELLMAEWLASQSGLTLLENKEWPDFELSIKNDVSVNLAVEATAPFAGKEATLLQDPFEGSIPNSAGVKVSRVHRTDPGPIQRRIKSAFYTKHKKFKEKNHPHHNVIAIGLENINPFYDPLMLSVYLGAFYPMGKPVINMDLATGRKAISFENKILQKHSKADGLIALPTYFSDPHYHEISAALIIPSVLGSLILRIEDLQAENFQQLMIKPIVIHNLKASRPLPKGIIDNAKYEFYASEDPDNTTLLFEEAKEQYWI